MVEKGERKWLWGFLLVVMIFTTLPYLIGYFRQGENWRFTGIIFGVEDGNSYIAKMLRGANGEWLFRTPYTPYLQRGALVYFPLIFLGKLTAPPAQHEQLVALYHLFRLGGIILYGFATYDFIALFVHDTRWRRLGTALATLGGGLGWLHTLGLGSLWGKGMPLEYYSPETFGFLMIYGLPHLACARALLLWGLHDYLRVDQPFQGWRAALRTGLLWLGVGIMQPLTVVVGWAVIGTHIAACGLWQLWLSRTGGITGWDIWRIWILRALRTGVLSAPMVVYTLLAFRLDPYLKSWEGQNMITSPALTHYLLAYGMILPLAVLGARALLREAKWWGWLVLGWVAVFPVLAYAPYGLQRRLPEGVWVAIIILFMKWIEVRGAVVQRWAPRWSFISFFSAIILITGGSITAWSPRSPVFVPAGAVQAFEYLGTLSEERDQGTEVIVLASYETSNPLPAWAAVRTITGHGPESVNSKELRKRVKCFFDRACTNLDRTTLIFEMGIKYVIWGPNERRSGTWDPRGAPFLEPIYNDSDYWIFAVKKNW
jgi:hypothetical protein